jgi:Ca2+-binding EF-hand superfamily protein
MALLHAEAIYHAEGGASRVACRLENVMKLAQTLVLGIALFGSGAALAQTAAPAPALPAPGGCLFERFDANRDGRVTWEEAWSFVNERFNAADADHSGGLTRQELNAARMSDRARRRGRAERMERMRGAMFRSLDANGDGTVTLAEIEPFAQARFRALDANGDGAVTRDELPRRGWRHHHRGHRRERGERAAPATPAPADTAPAR